MHSTSELLLPTALRQELTALQRNWLVFVLFGGALVLLGLISLGALVAASLASVLVIGTLLVFGGITEIVGAFWSGKWSGFFFHLMSGLLSLVVGGLFLMAPVGAMLALTMLLAALLVVSGLFKIIAALNYRFTGWGWPLASGVIDLMLGILIWQQMPEAALSIIGLFVGISLLFRGMNWIGLGLAVRSLPSPADQDPTSVDAAVDRVNETS